MRKADLLQLVFILLVIAMSLTVRGDNIIGWRTDATGRYPSAAPVTTWSPTTNIIWKTPMPAWSNSTPVIVGEKLFVCAEPETLLCVSITDGKILWQKTNTYEDIATPEQLAKMKEEKRQADDLNKQLRPLKKALGDLNTQLSDNPDDAGLKKQHDDLQGKVKALEARLKLLETAWYTLPPADPDSGYSTPTPVSDGKHVYALFGTGVAACYDLDGNLVWRKLAEKPYHIWGHSSSPVLIGDTLLLHITNLLALDAATGAERWKVDMDKKLEKKFNSDGRWGTDIAAKIGVTDVLVTSWGDIVRVSDGQVLAKGLCELEYNAPIIQNNMVYFIQNGGKAYQLPDTAGDTITPQLLWQTNPVKERYYASPVYDDGLIYDIMQNGVFSVIDAATGKVIHSEKQKYGAINYPSITLAGKYLFVSSDNGITMVMEPGKEPKVIATNKLEPFRACSVFIGNRMYIRGMKNLYCIGTIQ